MSSSNDMNMPAGARDPLHLRRQAFRAWFGAPLCRVSCDHKPEPSTEGSTCMFKQAAPDCVSGKRKPWQHNSRLVLPINPYIIRVSNVCMAVDVLRFMCGSSSSSQQRTQSAVVLPQHPAVDDRTNDTRQRGQYILQLAPYNLVYR